ncbi:uncharacterized protein SCHCODRAFT_02325441 [Schizophyllum commune H4-8]|uniref:uncharacterized protein n=1 Tax=Schizophyllum commune (strain H4-8 / FGSC 9210) TaxID=578458 RepID=UPI00215F856F|nr:uncharacterized protein SCHCODRAFT_02325441 [Schizophyllum commune H4-8]KAI5891654.1 hypothetical protein SCHCODRAFT_02325441 [Schizophyllum commune H4-8]
MRYLIPCVVFVCIAFLGCMLSAANDTRSHRHGLHAGVCDMTCMPRTSTRVFRGHARWRWAQ